MLKLIVSRLTNHTPKRDIVKDLALYCTKPVDELDKDIRRYLKLPPDVPYWSVSINLGKGNICFAYFLLVIC